MNSVRLVFRSVVGFFRQTHLDAFPLRHHLRSYSRLKLKADAKAGLNVALLDVPQGMAYALVAGLPVQFGLFCSALSSLTGPFLASSRFLMMGPTNATAALFLSSFLALDWTVEKKIAAIPMLLLLMAGLMLVGAFLRVASVIQFISRSVVTGYITAAAVLIIVNQIPNTLGYAIPSAGVFWDVVHYTVLGLSDTHWPSLLVALITLGLYVAVKKFKPSWPAVAIALAGASIVTALLVDVGSLGVEMLRGISASSWALTLPVFNMDDLHDLFGIAFALAFLSILESSSIARTLAAQAGDRVDMNQQMMSMGAANLVNAFGSGMPVSGSLTRSVLNAKSGAVSPASSVFNGVVLLIVIVFCGALIGHIPKPALAIMVICVGVSLISVRNIKVVMRSTRSDAAVFLTTFISGLLFPLDTAIYFGAAISIILFLKKVGRPEMVEYAFNDKGQLAEKDERVQTHAPEISIMHVEGELFFGAAEMFNEQTRALVQNPNLKVVVLRLKNARHMDATTALAIGELVRFARGHGCDIVVSGVTPDLERVFRNSGLLKLLGEANFFPASAGNPTIATRDALKRAQEIIGAEKAHIVLFAKEHYMAPESGAGEGDSPKPGHS